MKRSKNPVIDCAFAEKDHEKTKRKKTKMQNKREKESQVAAHEKKKCAWAHLVL